MDAENGTKMAENPKNWSSTVKNGSKTRCMGQKSEGWTDLAEPNNRANRARAYGWLRGARGWHNAYDRVRVKKCTIKGLEGRLIKAWRNVCLCMRTLSVKIEGRDDIHSSQVQTRVMCIRIDFYIFEIIWQDE